MEVSLKPVCPRTTRSRIARLKRDLIEARQELERASVALGNEKNEFEWPEIIQKIKKKWALKYKEHDGCSGYLYISHKFGLVVKRSYLCRRAENLPQAAIYTEIVPCNDVEGATPIYIQPKANVSRRSADRALAAIEDHNFRGMSDLHEGNVAVFCGEAVLIDW
jgi:hypothetical protein